MRNLKKFLALFLAMVMAASLMLTANAAGFDDYPDKGDISTAAFSEAVEVLTGLGVLGGDDRGFRPQDYITRAEVAAVIYRIATGDVTDSQVNVYADYGNYVDVKPDAWYAGYVGYCTNAGYIKGQAGNRFNPSGYVSGYQALAMILRAVGYDKNKEFEGASWQVNVASLSKQLGVTRDVVNTNFETTLNRDATREVIADLLFMTIATVPTVTYTTSLQYNDKISLIDTNFNPTLGQKIFGLSASGWTTIDDWGRPGYYWTQGGVQSTTGGNLDWTTPNNGGAYMNPVGHPIYTTTTNVVATIEAKTTIDPFTVAKLECDVAAELGFSGERSFRLYVNGDSNQTTPLIIDPVDDDYRIVATDVTTKVGGQGRLTEIYYGVSSRWIGGTASRVVMIDTLLAQVTNVTECRLDQGGHVVVPAKMEVTIYDGGTSNAPAGNNGNSKRIISKPTNSKDNWDFSKGDMILIHAYTNKTARDTEALLEAAAFQTDPVIGTDNPTTTLTEGDTVWIAKDATNTTGKAPSFTGKQTTAYWNANKHQVDGKDYDDQLELFLDRAGRATNTTFTWWQDNYGNIIGITDAVANFGVITSIYAAFGQGETDTNGRVKAMANVKFADGHTELVAIDKFLMSTNATNNTADATGVGSGNKATTNVANDGTGMGLTAGLNTIYNTTLGNKLHTVELWPRYDNIDNEAMSVTRPTITLSATNDALYQGFLYLAPSTVTNADAHFTTLAGGTKDTYGILFTHMFQFVVASDDSVVAIEVAGGTNLDGTDGTTDDPNTGLYADKYNNRSGMDANAGNTSTSWTDGNSQGKIFKNLSIVVLSNTNFDVGTTGALNTIYVDNETQFMIYNGERTVLTYNGVNNLPGDVTIADGSEVDWADTDGDGRANYVYVRGEIPGVVTYNLFYNDGYGAQWNGTTGTIQGYLNGTMTTVTFNDYSMYNTVNNSMNYNAHLFALQITDGVVTSVMYAENNDVNATGDYWNQFILADDEPDGTPKNVSGTVLAFDSTPAANADQADHISINDNSNGAAAAATETTAADLFKLGTVNGNTYTVNTEAVYWHDSLTPSTGALPGGNGLDNVAYERVSQGRRIVVSGAHNEEYWLSASCIIVGEIEWLNQRECDVTMVYENNTAKSVVQLYITTDPDVTPTTPTVLTPANRPYGKDVIICDTNTTLASAVTSGLNNIVVYGTKAAADTMTNTSDAEKIVIDLTAGGSTGTNLAAAKQRIPQCIYFPYSLNGNAGVVLTIRDEKGVVVYSESFNATENHRDGVAADTSHYFCVDFLGDALFNPHTGTLTALNPMVVGGQYTFEITTTNATGTVVLSSGSFGMN